MRWRATGIGAGLCLSASALAQPVVIDGLFDDWAGVPIAATDPAGDASGAFDLTEVRVRSAGTVLELDWDTNAAKNLQAGSGSDGTVRITLSFESGDTLTLDTRARVAYRNGNPNNGASWPSIGYVTLPTTAMPRYETRFDVSGYASPGEDVSIQFSGSDSLSGPITHTLDQPADTPISPAPGGLDPDPCVDLRVVSLNTLQTGLTDPAQRDQLARILDALNPTVLCLQEEYNNSAGQIKARLEAIDPNDNGLPWNVVKDYDTAVCSQFPLIYYDANDSFTTALVDLGNGEAVFVASMHPKCCGYTGDSNDTRRIDTSENLASIIADFRNGTLSAPLTPYADAPTVVIGDWNLVGSNTPLDLLTEPNLPGMQHWALQRTGARDAATWRDLDGFGFMPGMLDLVVHDTGGLARRSGFVLDTNELSPATLAAYALQPGDSDASDHYALVADYELTPETATACAVDCPADVNDDGILDNGDIGAFVTGFLAGDPAADFNNDGILDNGDIGAFVSVFLAGC
ncbi:MAG: GC-type dockerin domain-anchored protein [Phycisphaerales bacterium JB040]